VEFTLQFCVIRTTYLELLSLIAFFPELSEWNINCLCCIW